MPILLINRADDVLAPEPKTRWLAENLPNRAGYHVISGGERFFMYSQAGIVTQLIEEFLTMEDTIKRATWKAGEHEVGDLKGRPTWTNPYSIYHRIYL